jgi:hypothetical protein
MTGPIISHERSLGNIASVFHPVLGASVDSNDPFEFEAELRPNSPYYPMPEKENMGHKAYPFNPKFNEWVEDWKKMNKVD